MAISQERSLLDLNKEKNMIRLPLEMAHVEGRVPGYKVL
jgi:hypothetical protein